MTASLSVDDETQLRALLEEMGLKVDEVKRIEDLKKVLPKVKKEKKTPKENEIFPLELTRMSVVMRMKMVRSREQKRF